MPEIQYIQELLIALVVQYQYIAVFLALFLAGFGLPVPEEVSMFVAGYLAATGQMIPWVTFVVCFFGVLAGDLATYSLGRWGAGWVLRLKFSRWLVPPGKMAKFKLAYRRWGPWVLVVARLLPGLRFPTFFSSGMVELKLSRFLLYDGLAATVSVPILFGLAYYVGPPVWETFRALLGLGDVVGSIVGMLLVGTLLYIVVRRIRSEAE